MRRLAIIAFSSLLGSGPAFAHAFLQSATPAVGSTVHTAPGALTIEFTEGVEPAFSTIAVQNAQGARVDKNDPHLAPGSDKRLIVDLDPLPAGAYQVVWHATSVDTHKTEGHFNFTVAP
jgi:methionine-rich copper-binding protein CopC